MKTYEGIVHGQSIELTEPLELPDGVRVQVVLQPTPASLTKWGDGLSRCAGILNEWWTEEDDRILEEIARSRQGGRNRDLDLEDNE